VSTAKYLQKEGRRAMRRSWAVVVIVGGGEEKEREGGDTLANDGKRFILRRI
jgi:hypothetical protein